MGPQDPEDTSLDSTLPRTPLSHSQRQLWIGQRLHPESPLYNMAFAWVLPAELRPEVFRRAWDRVAEASDALRTRLVEHDGVPYRVEGPVPTTLALTTPWSKVDGKTQADDPKDAFLDWCATRCAQPLARDQRWEGISLVDSVLVDLGNGRHGWYLNLHHLITDAWSTVLLYRQVAAEYSAMLSAGVGQTEGSTKTGTEVQPLADYYPTAAKLATHTAKRSKALERAEAHWNTRRERPNRPLPIYGRQPETSATASTRWTLTVDAERTAALTRRGSEPGFLSLSSEMSRLALFATLLVTWLHRIADRNTLGFDAPVAGRPNADAKRALGLFIEMFPFDVPVEPGETFRSLGAKCLDEAERLLRHALPSTSAPSGASASNVVLNFFPQPFGDFAGMPTDVIWVHPGHGDSVHALRLQVHDFNGSGSTTLHFDWNDQALLATQCQRSLEHFDNLVNAFLADPDQPIGGVDLRTETERQDQQQVLHQQDSSTTEASSQRTVFDRFLTQAEQEPDRIALRQGSATTTFGTLRDHSAALAATLVDQGVRPGDRVAVFAQRSTATVVAILGILRARAAYVPVEPAFPAKRRQAILRNSGATWILGEATPDSASELTDSVPGLRVLALDHNGALTSIDVAPASTDPMGSSADLPRPRPDDLAYVLYTSGSTGRPKGVLLEHQGLDDYLDWAASQTVRGESLRFALCTSLAFDLTVTSLFLPLITGGELWIYPQTAGSDLAVLDAIRDPIEFIKLTPSHLALLRSLDLSTSRIRRLIIGGEDFKTQLAAEIDRKLGGRAEIINEYGPTEAVVGCIAHRFDAQSDTGSSVPIGVPADHVAVEILNRDGTPVPTGVPGELWITQRGLARGYLGLPGRTAEVFQPHPHGSGLRRYRTGDRVRQNASGELEFLGRLDRQLKLSGHRIEPAEIEAALLQLPSIEQCAVVAYRPEPTSLDRDTEQHCMRCGLPSSHPRAVFDPDGVCSVCHAYDAIKDRAQAYFKTLDDLRQLFEDSRAARRTNPATPGDYDCLMLLSGGKDSTFALCKLVEMGLRVYAFSLDNGFISEGAKENIRRVTKALGVPVEFGNTPAMAAIFRDSLERFANVCHGCFKTIYTLGTQRAKALGIPIVVTGLSRGQMFETRLTEEMFADGRFSPEDVDAAVLAARKVYHRVDDAVSRHLDVGIFRDDRLFDTVRFVDFYRYCDVDLDTLYATLRERVPWVRPEDTGRSTNCLINDLGIYFHKAQRGYHNYALPYSWDVRMGHKTREQALDELADVIDEGSVRQMLADIGGDVDALAADRERPRLVAHFVPSETASPADLEIGALRAHLGEHLPAALIPTHWQRLPELPLNVQGKVDVAALPRPDLGQRPEEVPFRAPDGPVEEALADLWREQLGLERVGMDDNFFVLGGTSLAAMEVMVRLCQDLDLDLPLETLFQHPTLAALARHAEDRLLADVAALSDTEREALLSDD